MHDVIIVGGGVAGLSAALILGRCRRNVLVCDSGMPRNRASQGLHGFLSRDGVHPAELRRIARHQLAVYPSVSIKEAEVVDAEGLPDGYVITASEGTRLRCRYLLLATGVVDRLPDLKGIENFYGKSVFHCPYCDGWEMRDQPIAVYGSGTAGAGFALELTGWSRDIVLCLDGAEITTGEAERLKRNGIGIRPEKISLLEGEEGVLERILFHGGSPLSRRGLFFSPDQVQASPLAEKLGCSIIKGVVETSRLQQTAPRLFVAGDAARSVQLAIVAAAEGAEAAFAINTALQKESILR